MSTRRASAAGSRQSIEARPNDEDVEMKDTIEGDLSDVDAEGEPEEDGDGDHDMLHMIQNLATYLCKVEEDGEELAAGFQRIPNRRMLPDYFDVISEPIAFSTIRGKIQRKLYTSFAEFVKDVAQICHNAQVYNRPSAPIFGAAESLREVFKAELQKLVQKGSITAQEATIPNLGDLPPADESPQPGSEVEDDDEDEEDEEEEDDEDDDDGDSDDEGDRSRRRRGRASAAARKDRDDDKEDDTHKKRGRPPSVLTPIEARIHNLLRGLRKPKDDEGTLLILPFERLPDKTALPDYYETITQPIALDQIKRKAKRKKYQNVEQALADVELMFENAKTYNEDGTPIFEAAVELQTQARILAEQEKAKPDEDFRDEDGKLPLAEIQHNGAAWRVGDWVHIRNPNDLAKPIVAQIFRTWQDREGQKWINACWYYRPEQTVHRFDKHFFEHEVVKTGQYRDHQIDDVLDHCFVMFVTRFPKGRPRGFPLDKAAYVCESRYNEEKYTFNKIKTWASCVPDEVRERDYEMDLFEAPRRMKKIPSPIKHLLRDGAKETDGLPKPTWGSPNAPPIVGAVHRRPREANESPPPEPTPPPPPPSAVQQMPHDPGRRASMMGPTGQADLTMRATPGPFHGGPPSHSPAHHNAHLTPHFQPATPSAGLHHIQQTPVPIPQPHHAGAPHPQAAIRPMPGQQQHAQQQFMPQQQYQYQQAGFAPQHPQQFAQSPVAQMQHRQSMGNTVPPSYNQMQAHTQSRGQMAPAPGSAMTHNMYNPPRPPEVYTLPDSLNEILPAEVRQNFQHDKEGRVLFFAAPPLDRSHKGLSLESAGLGHSVKYLAGREEWLAEREKKRKLRDQDNVSPESAKRKATEEDRAGNAAESVLSQAVGALDNWFQQFDQNTDRFVKGAGLEGWTQPTAKRNTA